MNEIWEKVRRLLPMGVHPYPWWLAYSWDHRLRRLIHNPEKILAQHVKAGDHVLDAGCGMGFFTIAMAGLTGEKGRVYALDIQRRMLDVLMSRARRRGVDTLITPILSDGVRPGVSAPVDFILSFWVLHEVDERQGLLERLFVLLKPDGAFLLVEPKIHTTERLFDAEVRLCLDAGFRLEGAPRVMLSRSALFRK